LKIKNQESKWDSQFLISNFIDFGGAMGTLFQDLRYGARMLMKSPLYTAVAVIALALGIGANTAIFSVVNAVLLRPLPYMDPNRLVFVETGDRQAASQQLTGASPADFWDWQDQTKTFEQLAAMSGGGFNLTGVEVPESIPAMRVSTNFFEAFGAKPLLGRVFRPDDGFAKAEDTIVLSYRLWQRRFGGDPDIVGKTLGNTGTVVVGVMPPDFKFPARAECWTTLSRDSGEMKNRANRYFIVVGLIKPDQTVESARAEMQAIVANLETQYPDSDKNITVHVSRYRDWFVKDVKTSLFVLLGAVMFVLAVACANVASILLARAASRRKEMAIRLAMGATRWALIKQLLTESLMLGLAGGVAGLVFALWGVDLLVKLLPEKYSYLQFQDMVRIDGTTLLFTLATALLTGLLFGLVPAWQSSRPDINDWLKEGSRGSDGSRQQRTRGILVMTEIALAMVLLAGAGLLLQSFLRLRGADLGFDPHNLFTMSVSLSFREHPDDPSRVRFIKRMADEVSNAPGVQLVAVTSGTPFPYLTFNFNIEGRPLPADAPALYEAISPNYFKVMKVGLAAGREFDERDGPNSPAVAIINETLARGYFDGEDPIGKRISINYLGTRHTREIIAVAKDMSQGEPGRMQPLIYVSYQQQPWLSASLIVRAATNPDGAKKDAQQAIWAVDKNQPLSKSDSAETVLSNALAEPRLYTTLLGAFAALALILAAVGIYGVMAYSVAERTREIGIRMALGAQSSDVLRMVIGQAMRLIATGVGIGLVAAFALTRLMSSLLYGVSATDPAIFAIVTLVLASVALLACYVPARKATKVDPMIALRYE
jgi:putative ABC transport system permease protein